jgi:hypothetical protein
MGMYTTLRVDGIVKEKYRKEIINLRTYNGEDWHFGFKKSKYMFMRKYFHKFYDYGALSHHYSMDEVIGKYWLSGEDWSYNSQTGHIMTGCTCKNYEGEFDYLRNHILPELLEVGDIREQYELEDEPAIYRIENSKRC